MRSVDIEALSGSLIELIAADNEKLELLVIRERKTLEVDEILS